MIPTPALTSIRRWDALDHASPFLQPFDHGRRERLVYQCAQAGVVGFVEIEHIAL